MNYEDGFSRGEEDAFKDRRSHIIRTPPSIQNEFSRGYHDGYLPRNPAWALRTPAALGWYGERESLFE